MSGRSKLIESLLDRARKGERAALDELVDLLRPDVERHVRALLWKFRSHKVHLEPEDVIHAIWEDLFLHYDKFREGNFELWFACRRRNRVLDHVRKEVRSADNLRSYFRSNPQPPGPSKPEYRLESRSLLEQIDRLSPRQKAVITLYYGKGWTFREIGDFLEIQETSVGSLHARALKKLRMGFEKKRK